MNTPHLPGVPPPEHIPIRPRWTPAPTEIAVLSDVGSIPRIIIKREPPQPEETTKQRQFSKARRGSPDARHHKFASLLGAGPEAIKLAALQAGPLGTYPETGSDIVSEALSDWRGNAAWISWAVSVFELSIIPKPRPGNRMAPESADNVRSLIQSAKDAATAARAAAGSFVSQDFHLDELSPFAQPPRTRKYPRQSDSASTSSNRHPLDFNPSDFCDGSAQVKLRGYLTEAIAAAVWVLGDHLRLAYVWPTHSQRPSLEIEALTQLGAVYASLITETLGEQRRMDICAAPGCTKRFYKGRSDQKCCSRTCALKITPSHVSPKPRPAKPHR